MLGPSSLDRTLFIVFGFVISLSSEHPNSRLCATLQSTGTLRQKEYLRVKSGSVFGNLAGEYFANDANWNVSGSWTLEPNCLLTACSGPYLSGKCETLTGSSAVSTWLSSKCQCNSECATCSSEQISDDICAKAYLEENPCQKCYAPYLELHPGTHDTFSEKWSDKISSLLVRPGCSLTVSDEEDLDGDKTEINGPSLTTMNDRGRIRSYECECVNSDANSSTLHQTQNSSYPVQIDIPAKLDQVIRTLSENNYNHPGLLSAVSSLTKRRSSKNVYMLIVGSSGAGKSSTINILLNNANVTNTGDSASTTSAILEFRIPAPVPEKGMKNSELRIIDTPGLADTRGLNNDAQFLATLDDYLSNHEELSYKLPNLVLIFHKFVDNRFHGEGAQFVRMLRGLDSLREKITDSDYSNVLFVFSHFGSSPPNIQKNPTSQILNFKQVIEMYSTFPKPILTAVVENKASQNFLPMINGHWELPNKELYPQNLLNKLDAITYRGGDKSGNSVVNSDVLHNRDRRQSIQGVTSIIHPLVSPTHNKVPKYLNILSSSMFSANDSEVSTGLLAAWSKMDSQLKSRFPDSLQELQRYLNIKNIRTRSDLPQTSRDIFTLLSGINQTDAIAYLQETGLNLKAPNFPTNVVAGRGYDITKNAILSVSPIQMDGWRASSLDFALPMTIYCSNSTSGLEKQNLFRKFDTSRQYFEHVTRSLLPGNLQTVTNSTQIYENFVKKSEVGYYVKDLSCESNQNMYCFTAAIFYKLFDFDLIIPQVSKLNQEFLRRVRNSKPFNESSHESVQEWSSFFNDFGTHFVKSAQGGGRIDIEFVLPKSVQVSSQVESMFRVFNYLDDPLEAVLAYKEVFSVPNLQYSIIFRGGSQEFHMTDLSKISLEQGFETFQKWKKSIKFAPVVFPKEIVPVDKLFTDYFTGNSENTEIAEKIRFALSRLLTATLKYVEPTIDPKVLEELERQRKETEKRARELELEMIRKKEEEERQRLAEIAERKRRERAARELAERRRREEREAEEKRRRLQEQRDREVREEQERQRRQREEDRRRYEEQLRRQREEEARQRRQMWLRQLEWEEEQRRRQRSSCLKEGTQILMADYTSRNVEHLKIGDVLLDKDMKPTRILGLSYEFLITQKFHGFDNTSFFFTDTHLFAGPGEGVELQLYTTSTESLFAQNPLMEHLNISEFQSEGTTSPLVWHFDNNFPALNRKPVGREVEVFEDTNTYPEQTLIYFIQVDSPTGTYFAEGYVCRHEVPPLTLWPNTMSTLFSLFGTTGLETVGGMEYSMDTIRFIDKLSDDMQKSVVITIDKYFSNFTHLFEEEEHCKALGLSDFDLEESVSRLFHSPTMSTLGMEIYGSTGLIISKFLDNPSITLTPCQLETIQHLLIDTITRQIDFALSMR